MILDLLCPIELRDYEILHDDSDGIRAYIELFNLLDKRISHFDAVVRWVATELGEYIEMPFYAEELEASARTAFRISVATRDAPFADRLEVFFLRISFEDESPDWLGDPDRLIDIDLTDEIDGRMLNKLMTLTGRDAVRFPRKTQDYWICVCGHVNVCTLLQCRRCRRGRDTVLTLLSREAVLLEKAPELPETLVPEPIEVHLPVLEPVAPAPAPEPVAVERTKERRRVRASRSEGKPAQALRNIVFLIMLITVVWASLWLWNWLDAKGSRAKDVRPPVKIVPEARGTELDMEFSLCIRSS